MSKVAAEHLIDTRQEHSMISDAMNINGHRYVLREDYDVLAARCREMTLVIIDLLDGKGDAVVRDSDKEFYAKTCALQMVRDGDATRYSVVRQPDADGGCAPQNMGANLNKDAARFSCECGYGCPSGFGCCHVEAEND